MTYALLSNYPVKSKQEIDYLCEYIRQYLGGTFTIMPES